MKRKNMTKFDKAVSAAFTGHRFYNFSQQEVIRERLTKAILEAYEHGISNFISGFAIGIDLMAAQIVQSLKPSCPGMTLTAAIPFRGQADRFKPGDRVVYVDIIVIYIVLRAILAFLGAWWHGDGRNDFRRDR